MKHVQNTEDEKKNIINFLAYVIFLANLKQSWIYFINLDFSYSIYFIYFSFQNLESYNKILLKR